MLFGCDQIVDRSLREINKTKNNESTLTNKEGTPKSLDTTGEENSTRKLKGKENIGEKDLSHQGSKALKKKFDVIGTNKDGPYRSGENNRIRSAE